MRNTYNRGLFLKPNKGEKQKMNKKQTTKHNSNAVGAHDCAHRNNNEFIANTVGVDAHIDPHSRGITLVALIITVIVMLILVGVTINIALNGGLFGMTKEAVKQTKIEAYKEQIEAIRMNLLMEQITEGLEGKEYVDRYEEEIRKNSNFKDATIERKDENTINVTTKEGYIFEIT